MSENKELRDRDANDGLGALSDRFTPIKIGGPTITSIIIADRRGEDALDTKLLEAKFALGLILPEDMPAMAVEALEAGHDGPALRRLSALDKPNGWETDRWLGDVFQEMGMRKVDVATAALRVAKDTARQMLRSKEDPIPKLAVFERLCMTAEYPIELTGLFSLAEEVEYSAAKLRPEFRDDVLRELRELANASIGDEATFPLMREL